MGHIDDIINICFQDMVDNVFHKQLVKCDRLSI